MTPTRNSGETATLPLGTTPSTFRYLEIMATDVPWQPEITNERLVLTGTGDVLVRPRVERPTCDLETGS
ncbi:hypothetical protein Q3V37_25010 [Micromonospora profundi]|uniref:Uncharacterized protein n=1 Tax=Micromonospora profundi TaxID=1420889 RepID=A0AAJ6HPZ1_9ACTN|nr:hypothetical protein [Micromonospora profundi]WLS44616.1 hypothetical protein Q3V37_25010 [Micromonospora profundi]